MYCLWSADEIGVLKSRYPFSSMDELLKLLPNRARSAIIHKAGRLGLSKDIRWWSDAELWALRECYSQLHKDELLKLLPKKDWSSIRHKANQLALKKNSLSRKTANWKTFSPITLSDLERGYLAGMVDGEGTISITKAPSPSKTYSYYAPILFITNTNPALMARLRGMIQVGRFHVQKREQPNHKPKLVYSIAAVKAVKMILEQIVGVLTIKRRNAELVLEFIEAKEKDQREEYDKYFTAVRHVTNE